MKKLPHKLRWNYINGIPYTDSDGVIRYIGIGVLDYGYSDRLLSIYKRARNKGRRNQLKRELRKEMTQ